MPGPAVSHSSPTVAHQVSPIERLDRYTGVGKFNHRVCKISGKCVQSISKLPVAKLRLHVVGRDRPY